MTEAERQKARALARWEGEGGALGPSAKTDQALDEAELRILSRLGAALLSEWSKLPTDLQRAIFSRASTLHAATDGFRIKAEIARFLHDHKDD
ncbi:MAG: hypothetical protein ACREH4_14210 [Vitreimonas sp.]